MSKRTIRQLTARSGSAPAAMTSVPTILYVDCSLHSGIDRRRLDGLRRYAAARNWRVETLEHRDCTPAALREALVRLRPIGCAAECWCPETAPRPPLFGRTPVVYFEPPDGPRWRGAHGVTCDNAAVGRMAFEELSSTRPPAYAVVSCVQNRRWARERIEVFRECCRKAGANCAVSYFTAKNASECPMRAKLMIPWAAALPAHCAVFTVNDCCARCAAKAIAAAGRSFPRTVTLVGADGAEAPSNDRELAETVSSVRLDFELAGFRAAQFLAEKVLSPRCGDKTFPPLMVDRRKSTRGYGRREPRILEAMEMIRREACDGLTVAALASRFHGTRRLFDMRFREAAGHSALDEILNVRLARAMELLVHTNIPIASVAHFSGFNTELEFWKLFRKRAGMSPLRFRSERR